MKILKYHSPRGDGLYREETPGPPCLPSRGETAGRRLGLILDGVLGHGLVREGNRVLLRLRLLLPSFGRLGLLHELKENFTNLNIHIGRTGSLGRL